MTDRLIVIIAFLLLSGFTAHLFFGSAIFADAEERVYAITVRDAYKNEVHELSGIIMTESSCHDASVRTQDIDARMTAIIFETWERPFSVDCVKEPTPRFVSANVFANDQIVFKGMLNGEWVPITIVLAE